MHVHLAYSNNALETILVWHRVIRNTENYFSGYAFILSVANCLLIRFVSLNGRKILNLEKNKDCGSRLMPYQCITHFNIVLAIRIIILFKFFFKSKFFCYVNIVKEHVEVHIISHTHCSLKLNCQLFLIFS